MKKDKRVVAAHKNGLGDYKISMSIRSQINMSSIMDLVQEMFEQSELYGLVKYNKPYFSVKRIDSGEEISQGYYDEEPEVIPKKFKPYKPLWSTEKTDNELEMYKNFIKGVEEKIKIPGASIEDKLVVILIDIENMMRYMEGDVDNDVFDFIETVRENLKPNTIKPVKNCRCKESEEYEIPGFESKQEKPTYNATSSKPHSFPCRSCTKVDEECIPTDFEGGGCGECPKYEDRVWANILKNKEMKAQFEINKEPVKDRYLTNKELSMWLGQGNGQVMNKDTGRITTVSDHWSDDENNNVNYITIVVRKWEDEEWHKPTYGYCFGGE